MKSDMNINGTGTINEGEYNKISIAGVGRLKGNVIANSVSISGTCSGEGILKCKDIDISGYMRYKGEVHSDGNLNVNGYMKIKENLYFNEATISGSVKACEGITFNNAFISGSISSKKNCEGTNFKCNGMINIDGLLSADNINITIYKSANVKEIGGENIEVRSDKKINNIPLVGKIFSNKLIAETIEGDYVYLENTSAKKVSGKTVIIGKNCNIEEVNYEVSLEVNNNSKVNKRNFSGKKELN